MTSSNGNIFRVTGHLCGEFTGPRWIPRTKASDAELWCLLLMCVWINGWVNNREAGDLRRYRAHYDVIVMTYQSWTCIFHKRRLGSNLKYHRLNNERHHAFVLNSSLLWKGPCCGLIPKARLYPSPCNNLLWFAWWYAISNHYTCVAQSMNHPQHRWSWMSN